MKRMLVLLIKLYQHTIGVVLPTSCRFSPSCSHYAVDSIMMHGILRGIILTGWRILRCNPWCSGGFDPVPPTGFWKHAFTKSGNCRVGGYE